MQETSPDPMAGKTEWRTWLRGILADIPDPDGQSELIRRQIAEFLGDQPATCIASFSALPGEPSLLELITSIPRHRWVLPRVDGETLVFHHVSHPEQLKSGAFGIAEPGADLPVVPARDLGIILCPGLGFDRQGTRLGRGKGFYDRSLAAARPDALRIGIAFREQITAQLPADSHDISMNLIFSGSGSAIHPDSPGIA